MAMYYLAFFIKLFSSIKGGWEEDLLHLLKAFHACKAKINFQPFYKGGGKMAHFLNQFITDPPPQGFTQEGEGTHCWRCWLPMVKQR
jgi:hypothetical protein